MFIGHPRRINKIETLAPLKFNGTEIKRVGKTKLLRVIVDEKSQLEGAFQIPKRQSNKWFVCIEET